MMRRHGSIEPKGRGVVLPVFHPAARGGRSIFPSRVFDPDEVQRVLKSGHQSRKIGAFVAKGPRKGWPIFTLTLEERATCPRTCREWLRCYGNNMQAAERVTPGPELEASLERELRALARQYPAGFLVRLHVLGDFYSAAYVELWQRMLGELPALNVFGFTAHLPGSELGGMLHWMAVSWRQRFAMRFSGLDDTHRGALTLAPGETARNAILCPAQTGATDCCGTCALCWQSDRSIAFRRH
jgi:hypothetical protein